MDKDNGVGSARMPTCLDKDSLHRLLCDEGQHELTTAIHSDMPRVSDSGVWPPIRVQLTTLPILAIPIRITGDVLLLLASLLLLPTLEELLEELKLSRHQAEEEDQSVQN